MVPEVWVSVARQGRPARSRKARARTRRPSLLLWLLAAASAQPALGQTAYLVTDLSPTATSEDGLTVSQTFPIGKQTLFTADPTHFVPLEELWVTDGTAAGTQRLPVGHDDPSSTGTTFLTQLAGTAILIEGRDQLWRSDGTKRGTYELPLTGATLTPFADVSVTFKGSLYFLAAAQAGAQLWRSDGTVSGTAVVEGFTATGFQTLATTGDKLFLVGSFDPSGNGPLQLWASDGTRQGTNPLPEVTGIVPGWWAVVGERIVVLTRLAQSTTLDLWSSDGTGPGTQLLTQLVHPPTFDVYSEPILLGVIGNRLYFDAEDVTSGTQVWSTDLTPSGTRPVTTFKTFVQNLPFSSQIERSGSNLVFMAAGQLWTVSLSDPASLAPLCPDGCSTDGSLTAAGQRVVFTSFDDAGDINLWSTDGTTAGTVMVKPSLCSTANDLCLHGSHPLTALDGEVYFTVGEPIVGSFLWRTDGTARGTRPAIDPSRLSCGPLLGTVQGKLLVNGFARSPDTPDLWVSDGTPAGTRQLTFEGDPDGFTPSGLVGSGKWVFFLPPGGETLFSSDGTAANTQAITHDATVESALVPAFEGTVFMAASGASQELWYSDGTVAGTRPITDLEPLRVAPPIVPVGGEVYFVVQSFEGNAGAIWRTDGTAAGTSKVFDLPAEMTSLKSLSIVGDGFYLVGFGPIASTAITNLWRSDGTTAGTLKLTDFGNPGGPVSVDPAMAALGGLVYFTADAGRSGLYQTDGTPAGTALVQFGAPSLGPFSDLTVAGPALYFFAVTPQQNCLGLWRLDSGGPLQRLTPFCNPSVSFNPAMGANSLTPLAGGLAFSADDGTHGSELWWTDGTAAGTRLLRDINPGSAASNPSGLVLAGGRLFFAADDGLHGVELWQSDGTAAGTRMVQDIAPGPDSSSPSEMTVAGNLLFFTADDGLTGNELWAMPLAGASGCQPSATALCLLGGRFRVEVRWDTFTGIQINTGAGQAAPLTDDTGAFWFFDPGSIELIVKVLDGRAINASFWVFYGALSNVQYAITVTDTQTGLTRRYLNPNGQLASVGDVSAFGPDGATAIPQPAASVGAASPAREMPTIQTAPAPTAASTSPCVPGPRRLCLDGNRFAIEASWTDFTGRSGVGRSVALSAETGYFWFFNPASVETVIKIIDGRPVNGKFWLFYGALSDVAYTLTVTDTTTGTMKTYSNPAGRFASVADTSAF